ncbi:hypothetical protein V491_04682, partial [Pseudogymnoascus sp. VKM F-3775]
LREENERVKARGRGKGVKDVVSGDGFEVSVFLTETSTRHTVLKRRKIFREPERKGETDTEAPAALLREEDDDVVIQDVPPAPHAPREDTNAPPPTRRSKRTRPTEYADTLFVADSDASTTDSDAEAPPPKRARPAAPREEEEQDEKKMAMRNGG